MINATIPLRKVQVDMTGVPATVYFDLNNIQIAFGQRAECISFEFVLRDYGELRMVTRRFIDNKLVADVVTVATGLGAA